jgi:hypothetical protein
MVAARSQPRLSVKCQHPSCTGVRQRIAPCHYGRRLAESMTNTNVQAALDLRPES